MEKERRATALVVRSNGISVTHCPHMRVCILTGEARGFKLGPSSLGLAIGACELLGRQIFTEY